MPSTVMGAFSPSIDIERDYPYEYPMGLDLHPSSQLHRQILAKILKRVEVSHSKLESRRKSWRSIDRTLSAYVSLDDAERLVKRQDSRVPVSIIFPHSYSILETLTAFMDSLFLRTPIFRYEGNSPEDTIGAILLGKVVEAHCKRFKVGLSLHTAFKDGIAYGIGAVFPQWRQKWGYKTRSGYDEFGQQTKQSEPTLLFEGNALENVDPYQLLLDPNYGVQQIQDSEFVGFVRRTNYYNLLPEDGKGSVFNVRYLKGRDCKSRFFESQRDTGPQNTTLGDSTVLRPIDVIYFYINLIPKDWGLGDLEEPEKWLFAIAGDTTIIQAQPLDLDHNMFPIAVCAPTFDGYSTAPLSRLEEVAGMQTLLDWLFNSHITNVRKTINDMIIYDPFMLNTADLTDPKPGKLIRARRAAWGKDLRGSVMQLKVDDITRQNINDAQLVMQMINQISGADQAMMGMLRQGGPERLSAAEFSGTQQQAFGRLESLSQIVGSQIMQDIGYMFAMHTQQLMSEDVWVSAVGAWEEQLLAHFGPQIANEKMRVRPSDLNVDFDVEIDADQPGKDVQFWVQMFDIISKSPELNMLIDVGRVFRYIAEQMGAKNVDNFMRMPVQPVGMPTQDVMAQADAGNAIPVQEVANALGGTGF